MDRHQLAFHENFEPTDDSKVKVADVRRALRSPGNESNGRNFRPWLSRILGGIPIQTQSIGGKSWLMGYRTRAPAGIAEPQPPPAAEVEPPVPIDHTNQILQAMQAISVERFGPDAPRLAEAARQVHTTLNELHEQAEAYRDAVVQWMRLHQAWAREPQAFLQHLIGERADVFVRPDYKPFYTLGPGGRRQYRSTV